MTSTKYKSKQVSALKIMNLNPLEKRKYSSHKNDGAFKNLQVFLSALLF